MFEPSSFLKKLRASHCLSQRDFARLSKISFRQIQRIEKKESDITWSKLQQVFTHFEFKLNVLPREPGWDILQSFGLALNLDMPIKKLVSISTSEFLAELNRAMSFILEVRDNPQFGRHFDCLKALLLALKIHYPTLFQKLQKKDFPDITASFELEKIEGRHIKLRNISLGFLAKKFRNLKLL